jgi:hypothetical protein
MHDQDGMESNQGSISHDPIDPQSSAGDSPNAANEENASNMSPSVTFTAESPANEGDRAHEASWVPAMTRSVLSLTNLETRSELSKQTTPRNGSGVAHEVCLPSFINVTLLSS